MTERRSAWSAASGHPAVAALIMTVAWSVATIALAEGLPSWSSSALPDLRSIIVNAVLLAAALALVVARRRNQTVALGRPVPDRSWLVLLPLLVFALASCAPGGVRDGEPVGR